MVALCAKMAERKARTFVVKLPLTATIINLKKALEKETKRANPTVIQDLGAGQFLVEFETKEQAEEFIDGGLDFDGTHIECCPPNGCYVNVSILGLRAYVSEDAVLSVLEEFREIKSEVIRLKYKSDQDFAGNRLVKTATDLSKWSSLNPLSCNHSELMENGVEFYTMTNNEFAPIVIP